MNKIVSQQQIIDATVIIHCGDSQGTGFYISETKILTAWHVVSDIEDDESLVIGKTEYNKSAIIAIDKTLDICLIQISKGESFLPIKSASVSHNQECTTFGFPYIGATDGETFTGRVDKIKLDHHWDFSFTAINIDGQHFNYDGLSGAVTVSNGYAIGFVRFQNNNSICAVSFDKASEFLTANGIEIIDTEFMEDMPEQINNYVQNSSPNYEVFEVLTEKLTSQSGWFYCHGSPGSGKTTFSAWYNSEDSNIKICGRYFTKIPFDEVPISIRTSKNYLIEWVENSIRNTGVPVDALDGIEKRIERIPLLFALVSQKYSGSNCVFIIDGLDEVKDLDDFLSIFPNSLQTNISIVLSGTSTDILPTRIKEVIEESHVIEVTPLNIGQCEAFIRKGLTNKEIKTESIQSIAIKSEGHPLYLQYLIGNINNLEIIETEIDNWIEKIPIIGGDITIYYDSIWDDFFREEGRLWIVIILSQLRAPIEKNDLIQMLPNQYQLGFLSNFDPILYLIKFEDSIEIYHASFKKYVSVKAELMLTVAHDNILRFCISHRKNEYSIEHKLYHQLLSSNNESAIHDCNQDWADDSAFNHVSPELVITDIQSTIQLAIDYDSPNEVVRLLLLLQRVQFRYNSVLADNATSIASTLISMNNIKAAMKYLIRENTLLVSDEDGLYFLQLLYERGYLKEAERILEVFNRKYRRYMQDEFARTEEGGFSLLPLHTHVRATTLSYTSRGKDAFLECINTLDKLKSLRNIAEKVGDSQMYKVVNSTRISASSWMSAYLYRSTNYFQPSIEVSKQFNLTINEEWCTAKAMSLIQYEDLKVFSGVHLERFEKFQEALDEIVWLATNYGYEKDIESLKIILLAIMNHSKEIALIETIAKDYLNVCESSYQIRAENGVDFNGNAAFDYYFRRKCEGYTSKDDSLPNLPDKTERNHNWESFLKNIIGQLGFIDGVLSRAKFIEHPLSRSAKQRITEISNLLDLQLYERSNWERSYLLPESALPYIYVRILDLLISYSYDNVDSFIHSISKRYRDQFGLYSEGYRDCLSQMIQTMILKSSNSDRTIELIDQLSGFVVKNVQNRWERTPELLQISEYYALLNKEERASALFKEMLQTSMGPSWYKEAQYQLLNSTFRLNCTDLDLIHNTRTFASLLDQASGEMTFQRYVRHAKESFVGNLAYRGLTKKAVKYLLFETIPPPKTLIYNAENNEVDSLFPGFGYSQGARNIILESGLVELLKKSKDLSPTIKSAIGVSFIINDDVDRYFIDYCSEIIEGLNSISEEKFRTPIYNEICATLNSKQFEECRASFILEIREHLRGDYYSELVKNAKGFDIILPENIDLSEPSEDKEKSSNEFFKFLTECNDNPRSLSNSELAQIGITAFEKERISVWFSNWSHESTATRQKVKELIRNPKEIIQLCKSSISKIDTEIWSAVDTLLWFFEETISKEDASKIYSHVINHFELLVHPTEEVRAKYDWMAEKQKYSGSDLELIRLMLQLINHPLGWVKAAAKNSIELLSISETELVLKGLIKESLNQTYSGHVKESLKLLKLYTQEFPEKFCKLFEEGIIKINADFKEKYGFKVLYVYKEIGEFLSKKGHSKFYEKLLESIPDSIGAKKEVAFEEEQFASIQWQIDSLNEEKILNGEFCEQIIRNLNTQLLGLSIEELDKSDDYLRRSYSEAHFYDGRLEEILDYCMSKAIMCRVDKDNIDTIAKILIND